MKGKRFAAPLLALLSSVCFADKVDDHIAKLMAESYVPGMQLGIYKDGRAVKLKGYGRTEAEGGIPVTESTLFNIGSITKQFTAAAVLLLAEEGKLSVEDSVRKSLPSLPESFEPVKLRHVLSHVSGLGDYASVPGFDFHGQATEDEFLGLLGKAKLGGAPGERYAYSNIGYALLGIVIHRVSGQPYRQFVVERIFRKLGMSATKLIEPGPWPQDAAVGFNWVREHPEKGKTDRAEVAAPSGAILTNVRDMAKWDAALRGEGFLKKASLDQMWTPALLNEGKSTNYGFGWNILKTAKGTFVTHTGATVAGFRAAIVRQLDGPYSAVIFANLGAELGLTKVLNDVVGLWKEIESGGVPQSIPELVESRLNAA